MEELEGPGVRPVRFLGQASRKGEKGQPIEKFREVRDIIRQKVDYFVKELEE